MQRCRMRNRESQRGAVLLTFMISALALILFAGLTIDVGFIYLTRAALAKGVDSAALTAIRHLNLGEDEAISIADSIFVANQEGATGEERRVADADVDIDFTIDDDGAVVDVDATVDIRPFFISVLPQWNTFTVTANAQAGRVPVILGLALDRSQSMEDNEGADELPGAVEVFVDAFSDDFDSAAMASFASHATLDVDMRQPFQDDINSAVDDFEYEGFTFTDGGFELVADEVETAAASASDNAFLALVLFTDGNSNTFQDDFDCEAVGGPVTRTLNVVPGILIDGITFGTFRSPTTGNTSFCFGPSEFDSESGSTEDLENDTITAEGVLRMENSANAARNLDITVYTVGLGEDIDETHLRRIANTPDSDTHNSAQPEGLALFAPEASELASIFNDILQDIQIRITR